VTLPEMVGLCGSLRLSTTLQPGRPAWAGCVMSPLHTALDEYLAMRRAFGHELRLAGHLLKQFVAFADRAGATYVTADLTLAWATQPARAQPAEWARRLGIARRFAEYCSALDPRTTVPPPGLLPHRYQRPPPYIYRDEEITRLLEAVLVSGATNYPGRCSAPTSISSSSRTGIRYSSLRRLAAKLGQWSMWMYAAAGDHPTTSTIFVAAAMSRR
jgi:hypothetical protein